MFIKQKTYISRWDGIFTTPIWSGELDVRGGSSSHRKALGALVVGGDVGPGLYLVSTPLPNARTPRCISNMYRVEEDLSVHIVDPDSKPKPPSLTTWPPKY